MTEVRSTVLSKDLKSVGSYARKEVVPKTTKGPRSTTSDQCHDFCVTGQNVHDLLFALFNACRESALNWPSLWESKPQHDPPETMGTGAGPWLRALSESDLQILCDRIPGAVKVRCRPGAWLSRAHAVAHCA